MFATRSPRWPGLLLAAAIVCACGCNTTTPTGSGQPSDSAPVASGSAVVSATVDADSKAPPEPSAGGDSASDPGDNENGDDSTEDSDGSPEQQIAALHAIPAWAAVTDRAQLLLRRGQRGVVYGVVGPLVSSTPVAPVEPPDADSLDAAPPKGLALGSAGFGSGGAALPVPPGPPLLWLIDDSTGNGSLAIRVEFQGKAPAVGSRVAVGGAWTVSDSLTWYWKADAMTSLGPRVAPPEDLGPPPPYPGHVVRIGEPPAGSRPVSKARDNSVIRFQVIAAPDGEGDGWKVADELGDPPDAILYLPGERLSYGGHNLTSPDELWHLKRGVTYWVHIGKVKKRSGKLPPLLYAHTAPVKW